jgi:hypothetical protein
MTDSLFSFSSRNDGSVLRAVESRENGLKTNGIRRSYRVVVHGLPHFCQKLSGLLECEGWDVRYHSRQTASGLVLLANDLRRCDLAYTWGGRVSLGKFLGAAKYLGKQKLVMLWSGSDVFFGQEETAAGKMNPWIAKKIHWAVSPWIAEEVRALGLQCDYVQVSFVEPVKEIVPLPAMFSVLVYVPDREKAKLYGWDQIVEVANALRSVEFHVVGLREGEQLEAPPNVKLHGWARDMKPHLERATVLWRPVEHDGLSFMVLEALAQGRHVIYSYPLEGCAQATTALEAQRELKRLLSLHDARTLGINSAGIQSIAQQFTPAKVRGDLLRRWEEIILQNTAAARSRTALPAGGDRARQPTV